ncbi:MAG: transposase [Phycisphaerales bacterium]|nr:transposase [Phycisphaerales bacterium]
MKRKRHTTDEVVRKLREAELLEGQGQTIGQVCQQLEISEQTLQRWRNQFRGMGDDQIKRLKELEEENRRLKKAVADLVLDKQIIEEVLRGRPQGAAPHKDGARRRCVRGSSVRCGRWRSRSGVCAGPSGSSDRRSGTGPPDRTRTGRWRRRCLGWRGSTLATGTGGFTRRRRMPGLGRGGRGWCTWWLPPDMVHESQAVQGHESVRRPDRQQPPVALVALSNNTRHAQARLGCDTMRLMMSRISLCICLYWRRSFAHSSSR